MTRTCENIARIVDILKEVCQSSCRLIAEQMEIPKTIVQQILREDLQKWKLCTWYVPHALSTIITRTTLLKQSKVTQTFCTP